jgi:hypothetical protein
MCAAMPGEANMRFEMITEQPGDPGANIANEARTKAIISSVPRSRTPRLFAVPAVFEPP